MLDLAIAAGSCFPVPDLDLGISVAKWKLFYIKKQLKIPVFWSPVETGIGNTHQGAGPIYGWGQNRKRIKWEGTSGTAKITQTDFGEHLECCMKISFNSTTCKNYSHHQLSSWNPQLSMGRLQGQFLEDLSLYHGYAGDGWLMLA